MNENETKGPHENIKRYLNGNAYNCPYGKGLMGDHLNRQDQFINQIIN